MTAPVGLHVGVAVYSGTPIRLAPPTDHRSAYIELGVDAANQVTIGFATAEDAVRLADACYEAAAAIRRRAIHAVEVDR